MTLAGDYAVTTTNEVLTALATHATVHDLPTPMQVTVTFPTTRPPVVHVCVRPEEAPAWCDSLELVPREEPRPHYVWHIAVGLWRDCQIRVSYVTLAAGPLPKGQAA